MLDTQQLQSVIKNSLGGGEPVKDGVFRYTRKYAGKPISYYYFDFSEKLEDAAADLKKYQDDVISEHYFANSGETQWNYYLIFLLSEDKYLSLKDSSSAAAIEKDKLYCRKFILPESKIKDFLDIPVLDTNALIEPAVDLATRWEQKLNAIGLSEIGSRLKRTEVIRNYIAGIKAPEAPESVLDVNTDLVSNGKIIRELQLKTYRSYPLQREFKFGLMNLFVGANGTGKTSLLESIELAYCGATLRAEGEPELGATINFRFDGDTDFQGYDHRTVKKYQQRDLLWYGRSISRGNDLYSSFNKYNFYNTDSAYKLANDSDDISIDAAFSSLALGEKANHLDARMKDFLEDFTTREASQRNQLKVLKDTLASESNKIAQISTITSTSIKLFEIFQSAIANLSFVVPKPNTLDELETTFSLQIFNLQTLIRGMLSKAGWLSEVTPLSIREGLKAYQIAKDSIDKKEQEISGFKKSLLSGENSKKDYQSQLNILKQLRRYYEDDRYTKLSGLSDRLQKAFAKVDFLVKLNKIFSEISNEERTSATSNISAYDTLNRLKDIIDKEQSELKSKELAFQKDSQAWSSNQKMLSELKALTTSLLHENPHLTDCPVCEASYPIGKLRQLVDNAKTDNASSILTDKKIEIENLRADIQRKIAVFHLYKKIHDLYVFAKNGINFINEQPSNIFSQVEKELKATSEAEAEYNQLRDQATAFNALGLTESDFNRLRLQIPSQPDSLPSLDLMLKKVMDDLSSIEVVEADLSKKINDSEKMKDTFATMIFAAEEVNNRSYERELSNRLNIFKELHVSLQQLTSILLVDDSQDFKELQRKLDDFSLQISHILNAVNEEKKSKIELDEAIKRSTTLKVQVEQETLILNRLSEAKQIISEILNKDGKEQALSAFIENNRNRIDSIFSRIHSPQEFKGLSPGTTKLLRNGESDPISLNKVSTGQRAALALSVFFALNLSLKEAPPVILIDDPVAYVDDLNTLSFLDFLREMVVKSGRQVFFATASHKLASLIEKKFKFLGDEEFKRFDFSRT